MRNNTLDIIATTVKAENGKVHKENCSIEDLIQVLSALNCPVSIEITVLERVKPFCCN
ncbi:MAG: hypothetical protein ACLQF0_09435 [Dissulfurispiraceae bacterium]